MTNLPFSKVRRSGSTVYLSGEVGVGSDGKVPHGIEAQTRNCLETIKSTLASEGLDLSHVLSCTCYLTDPADFSAFNAVYAQYFSDPLPVRTTIGCQLMIDAKVEITVIAEA
ncbi:RidA family protein [uncultured Cohaesibacter sp.]|uniref:RidA family protein n=1 Tax=uncultured Cohaesibacter sp. TaxID=1002546 RepID=UPI00292DAE0E|nr:RidA family protein [uncultured Cohaesibacter sp.]